MLAEPSLLDNFFLLRDGAPTALMLGRYQPWLVLLSVVVASLTSAVALQLAGMARTTSSPAVRQLTLLSGSLAMGGGIWSMHFIGMLAFSLCTQIEYDGLVTGLSMLPGVFASWVALALLARGALGRWLWVLGGVLVGAGIGAMHYTGMAAMELNAQLRYDPLWFGASIVVAVLLAMLALWIRFGLEQRVNHWVAVALGGLVMGCAIAGMHYTAMGAARFVGPEEAHCLGSVDRNGYLALGITMVTLTISLLTAGANGLLRYRLLNRQLGLEKQRIQAMLDTAVDGILTTDRKGVVLSFNGAAEPLLGWAAEDIIGRHVSELMPSAESGLRDPALALFLETGNASVVGTGRDVLAQRRDGSHVPVRLALGRVEHQGEVHFIAFVTDISERQRMEHALRQSEELYRSLIANSPGVTFRCKIDDNWTMVLVSEAMETLSGWPTKDFLAGSIHCGDLVHLGDRDRVNAAIHAAVAANQPYSIEYRLMRRDGGQRWVSETGRGARDEHGVPQWIDGVIVDIDEAKQLQRQLEQARDEAEAAAAAKSAFLANMSHEIRTPMNAILGFSELMLDTQLSDLQRKYLSTVRGSARSLLGLLNNILDTAKLEKGAVELEQMDFSLLAVCEQTLNSLSLSAQRKSLKLSLDYPEAEPRYFKGDPLRVQQVLVNMVGNAVKFTEKGGVRLSMRLERGQIHLTVVDTGIGIAADRIERIFDAFAQADASTTRRFGGTGLGTTISRQLVEKMGGRIEVQSELGRGSSFHIWLPLTSGRAVLPMDEAVGVQLPPLRLLIADDVPQNLELLQLMLAREGHQVRAVTNGLEALQAFTEQEFDAVLMDVHMPELDGLAATRRIRQFELHHRRARTPVIALTASVLEEDRQAALAAGMDGFSTKPIEPPLLRAEVARVLGLTPAQAPAPGAASAAVDLVLDHEQGLRLWDQAGAWRRALRRFAVEQEDGGPRLMALLRSGQWLEARALVHRWRGVAGSLALPRLQAAAQPIEEHLRQGRYPQAVADGERLVTALSEALVAIEELTEGVASAAAPLSEPAGLSEGGGGAPSPELTGRLERALRRGELDDSALAGLVQQLGTARCAALIEALDGFDFEQALRALAELGQEGQAA